MVGSCSVSVEFDKSADEAASAALARAPRGQSPVAANAFFALRVSAGEVCGAAAGPTSDGMVEFPFFDRLKYPVSRK